ncbi:Double C2-like domain-containing protein beta [Stylophora pistillata]|uniref:Double C2-like domain-containing protein beta n=1 Tax=Stylophora pistillata TaxID=50429 RepID=A0A2B4SLY9_STYPI|nr:Double C2-like domain-containing protein beta [Stylophora pistillata]
MFWNAQKEFAKQKKNVSGESVMSDETITAEDKETPREGKDIPPLNLEDDEARPDSAGRSTARSTLQRPLVEKLENMHNNALGDGKETCLLCGSKFSLKVISKRCDICDKSVCEKCGLRTQDSDGDNIWLCMLCSEHREENSSSQTLDFFKPFMDQIAFKDTILHLQKGRPPQGDNLDGGIREERQSEDEESSSSSDEMLFDSSTPLKSPRGRSSTLEEAMSYTRRISTEVSMPGSAILENIDTPPPFRKRTLAMSQEEQPHRSSPHTSPLHQANGKLTPDSSHTEPESPKREKSGSFTGRGHVRDVRDEAEVRVRALVRKQDTEEEDIDELVRTFKESEASVNKDVGDAGLGTLEFDIHYNKQHSQLQVTVVCAKSLKAMDSSGTSDPYVKIHLLPGASKSNKLRTRTKYKTLNPKFDEILVYHGITDDDISKKSLRLQVLDEDKLGRNNFIGETCVALKIFHSKPSQSLKRSLVSRGSESPEPDLGRLQLSLKFKSQKNQLIVGVIRCAGLASMDANGYSDPYVKCYLKPDINKKSKRRTSVKRKTLNPEYNEEFAYDITHSDLAKKSLELTVWDHDVGKSNDFIGGVVLDINSTGSALMHWYAMLKNPNQAHTYWHTLEKLTNHEQE